MSIFQFDRTIILVSWCKRNWGENKMPLGRGGGVNSVGWEGRKNRETVTASLCLAFTELVAPATATPDWSRDNRVHQSTVYRWQLEWQEVAFITSRLSPKWHRFQKNWDCFDFDRLSVSSLGGSVLKREQTEAVSRSREDFPFCGSISAPRCIFERIARRILSTPAHLEILNRFPVKMYLVVLQ